MRDTAEVLVLFDRVCTVCRALADVVQEESLKNWRFVPWQEFDVPDAAPEDWHEIIPRELRVIANGRFLQGEEAWQFLLENNPRLNKYQLLAAKLGLSAPRSARWLRRIGHGVRRLCISCVYFRR